jgi:hypothetical protein
MGTTETTSASELSLSNADREKFDELRPLTNYRLHYVNKDFPILSFVFGVLAGGEYTLYCDHTEDYAKAYLGYDVKRALRLEPGQDPETLQDRSFRINKERRDVLFSVLARLEADRPKAPFPTPEEWDRVMKVLGDELKSAGELMPSPVW